MKNRSNDVGFCSLSGNQRNFMRNCSAGMPLLPSQGLQSLPSVRVSELSEVRLFSTVALSSTVPLCLDTTNPREMVAAGLAYRKSQ